MKPFGVGVMLSMVLAFAAACGGSTAHSSSASHPVSKQPAAAAKPTVQRTPVAKSRIIVQMPWVIEGDMMPFVVAKEKGYYADAGFDARVIEGKGSLASIEGVANGSNTFCYCDAGIAASLISKGAPVKVVATYQQVSADAFFYDPEKTRLATAGDLNGKTLLDPPGTSLSALLPAVLGKNNLSMSDVKTVAINANDITTALARNPEYIALDLATAYPEYAKVLPPVKYVLYNAFGVNTYSLGVVARVSTIQKHPNEIMRFIAATNKGWAFTMQNEQQAAQLTRKAFPDAPDEKTLMAEFDVPAKLLHTSNTQGKPLGWMSEQDWKATVDLLHRYGGVATVKPLSDYYTNEFVPQS